MKTIGSRAEVWHGNAKRTSGGLVKSELIKNTHGRIVSKTKHDTAKKEMRLKKYGYGTQKGHFGYVKLTSKYKSRKHKGKSRKHKRGGSGMNSIDPADVNSDYMIKNVNPQPFTPLDRALVGGKKYGGTTKASLMPYSLGVSNPLSRALGAG